MSDSLRNDNYKFGSALSVTADTNTKAVNVGGARMYSVLIKLTDNGSAAGTVSVRAGLTPADMVIMSNTTATMSFTTGVQVILINVADPGYKFIDVAFVLSAGDIDYETFITIIDGSI